MPNPPKPVERKRATGNPGKRRLPRQSAEVVTLPVRIAVPEHLGAAGAAIYTLVADSAAGWMGRGDRAVLLLLAEGADRRTALLERLRSDGDVLYTDKGYAYANPAAGMLSTLERQMTSWLSLLGLTPTDRARLGLVEVKRISKLDELRQQRQ